VRAVKPALPESWAHKVREARQVTQARSSAAPLALPVPLVLRVRKALLDQPAHAAQAQKVSPAQPALLVPQVLRDNAERRVSQVPRPLVRPAQPAVPVRLERKAPQERQAHRAAPQPVLPV
jgi:hypothetical protein